MSPQRERRIVAASVLLFLALQVLPLVAAYAATSPGQVFGGFLLNPYDSNSYLAKMRQGFEGAWQFRLPYTAEPGEPTALNVYYLLLGHISRWGGVPLLAMFHIARLGGALVLCIALYRFIAAFFAESEPRLLVFGLSLLGSGLGWLAAAFGGFTADLWWAEAYPFLSAYVNPHFVLGLAIQMWLLTPLRATEATRPSKLATWAVAAAILSVVYSFGWAATVAILTAWTLVIVWQRKPFLHESLRTVAVIGGGAPYAIYAYYTVQVHPVLSLWDAQNLTPTPGLGEVLVAFSPVVILALIGGFFVAARRVANYQFLAVWAAIIAVAIYAPANLQRRLATGLYIPLAGLAVFAIYRLLKRPSVRRWLVFAILLVTLPTNAIVVAGGVAAVRRGDPLLTLYTTELEGFRWLDAHAPQNALVLAAPQTGLFLPGYASVRVLFGHWFETVQAGERRDEIVAFFDSMSSSEASRYLDENGVDYIFYGPRERVLGQLPQLPGWAPVHETADLQIWSQE